MPDRRRPGPEPPPPESGDLEDLYDAEYLREVADPEARQQRLEELKRRIALGAYHPDPTSIAEGILSRGEVLRDEPEEGD